VPHYWHETACSASLETFRKSCRSNAIAWYLSYVYIDASQARDDIAPLREAAMYAPVRERHTPDPKCCYCGLRSRYTRGNDSLRLVIVVLLLLPVVLMLFG